MEPAKPWQSLSKAADMSTTMEATTLLLSITLGLLYTIAILGGTYAVTSAKLRGAGQDLLKEVRSAIPQAEELFRNLKSESGRARSLLKKAGNTVPDDDDLFHALNHPMARGLLEGLGIDPDAVQRGDAAALGRLQEVATGKGASNVVTI